MGETTEAFADLWHFLRTNDWKQSFRSAFRRKYWGYWLLLAAVIAASVLLSIYQKMIVQWLVPWQPAISSKWWSWIVVVALLIVFAMPPLVGHVVIVFASGMIYGFRVGCAIVAGGTVIGEYLCFVLIRALFLDRAQKTEATSLNYACTATLLRTGGVWINSLVRVSFLSGHVVTALQAVAGVKDWVFVVSMLPSLPYQFATVFMGHTLLNKSSSSSSLSLSPAHQQFLSLVLYGLTLVVSALAAYVSLVRARRIYPRVREEMRGQGVREAEAEGLGLVERGKVKGKRGKEEESESEESGSESGESGYSGGY